MKLQLTRRGDYAVRTVLYLAKRYEEEGLSRAHEIAEAMKIPAGFLPQVLGDLTHGGLVQAFQGKKGGYRLASNPEELSLLEVIECVEGPTLADRCMLRNEVCGGKGSCAVHEVWKQAQEGLVEVLAAATVGGLVLKHDSPG